ncbi:MAG: PEP-CTERM sorting domain-containing protein [Bryobacteraceae bacterium]
MPRIAAVLVLLYLLLSIPASASLIPIGLISYDVVIPAGVAPGVNGFDIYDFTGMTYGPFAGSPYVTNSVSLDDVTLTIFFAGGGSATVQDNVLIPGEFGPQLEVPSNAEIASAELTATLSQTSFTLSDGSTFTALPDVTVDLLPSSGGALQAGVDFGVIEAQSSGSATPEPGTFILLSLGMAGLAMRWRQ